MHNLYVPPIKILFFLILLIITGFSARSLQKSDVPIPKFEITIPKPELTNEAEVVRPETTWSNIPIRTNGTDRKYGNIVSMQVYLRTEDFAKAEWWTERVEELVKAGKTANIYDRKTIIIFPEHIGTGLVFLDEKESVFENEDWKKAMETLVSKHETEIVPFLESSKKPAAKWEATLRFKSQRMADVYTQTFSRLAKEYNVPILAGSIILPSPKVVRGALVIDTKGPLYNVSIPFAADGKVMDPIIRKTLITEDEEMLIDAGEMSQDRTWVVPGWKVGVFIGQEVFHGALYEKLRGKPLDGIVSPSVSFPKLSKEKIKNLINDESIHSMNENEIWEKFGLAKFIKTTRAVESVQVFLHGSFFGEKTSGRTYNMRDFINFDSSDSDLEPRILNLYF
jgi:predicted amidohydrolase